MDTLCKGSFDYGNVTYVSQRTDWTLQIKNPICVLFFQLTKSILFLPYPVLHSVTVEDDINDSCKGLNPSVLFSQSSDVTEHVKMFILSNTTCISICLKVKQIFSVYWLLISVFLICVLICHLLKNVIQYV